MTADRNMRLEEITKCQLCETPGEDLYADLPDRLFGVPGKWGFLRCPECGLLWLNPRPVPEDIHKVYTTYSTHEVGPRGSKLGLMRDKTELALCATVAGYGKLGDGRGWVLLGRILSVFRPFKEIGLMGTMCLPGDRKGRLLDVGCGNGRFLSLMRTAGWEVAGVENDPVTARNVRDHLRIAVTEGNLSDARFPNASFDAVTLSHLIEHVYDPVELLRECRRILKPGGKLVIVTPNSHSLAHRLFGKSWRDLDPPRHLFVFSPSTIGSCSQKAGFRVDVIRTSPRWARGIWTASHVIRRKGVFSLSDVTWLSKFQGLAFRVREEMALLASPWAGEELLVVASPGG